MSQPGPIRMMIVRMEASHLGTCRCCGSLALCTHLDWELSGLVCRECVKPVILAELNLRSWVSLFEGPPISDWRSIAMHPDGRYYNAPRKERAT